jgi:hypothetical protein
MDQKPLEVKSCLSLLLEFVMMQIQTCLSPPCHFQTWVCGAPNSSLFALCLSVSVEFTMPQTEACLSSICHFQLALWCINSNLFESYLLLLLDFVNSQTQTCLSLICYFYLILWCCQLMLIWNKRANFKLSFLNDW